MQHNPPRRRRFPEVRGSAGFAHPVWPARQPRSETATLRDALVRSLGFRDGWVRRVG